MRQVPLLLLFCGALLTSCKQSPTDQARTLVEHYNRVVSEAYRRGDERLIGAVVGPKERKRLSALIGARREFGLTLDSHLLSLELSVVERSNASMRVRTKERWRYRDLRDGTREQVGRESIDAFEILYLFTNLNRGWLVDEVRVTKLPRVGQGQTSGTTDRIAAPGVAGTATNNGHSQHK